jgi:protein-S-isoprenylcysteine O-methyltransferase Ste14
MLGTGVMLKDPGKIQLILGTINFIAIWFTARIEEQEMITKFGADYKSYLKETKMFIPFII